MAWRFEVAVVGRPNSRHYQRAAQPDYSAVLRVHRQGLGQPNVSKFCMSAAYGYLHTYHVCILPENLAGADFCIESRVVELILPVIFPSWAALR